MSDEEQNPTEVVKQQLEEAKNKLTMANLEDTQGAAADLITAVRSAHPDYNGVTGEELTGTYGQAVQDYFALANHRRLGYLTQSATEGGEPRMKEEDQKIFEASLNGERPAAVLKAGLDGLSKGKFNEGITSGTSDLEKMTDLARAYSKGAEIQKGLISSVDPEKFKAYMASEWGVEVDKMDNDMYQEQLPKLVLKALTGKKPKPYEVLAMTTRTQEQ